MGGTKKVVYKPLPEDRKRPERPTPTPPSKQYEKRDRPPSSGRDSSH